MSVLALLGMGLLSLPPPALGEEDPVAAAERRAEAAERRARAAERRAKDLEKQLKAARARKAPHPTAQSDADRAAERETSRRLDDAITRQLLRDAGR